MKAAYGSGAGASGRVKARCGEASYRASSSEELVVELKGCDLPGSSDLLRSLILLVAPTAACHNLDRNLKILATLLQPRQFGKWNKPSKLSR